MCRTHFPDKTAALCVIPSFVWLWLVMIALGTDEILVLIVDRATGKNLQIHYHEKLRCVANLFSSGSSGGEWLHLPPLERNHPCTLFVSWRGTFWFLPVAAWCGVSRVEGQACGHGLAFP